jgi:hypothetical protein
MTASGDQTCHLWQAAISPEQMVSNFVLLSVIDQIYSISIFTAPFFFSIRSKRDFLRKKKWRRPRERII